jgi:hypothetical protein
MVRSLSVYAILDAGRGDASLMHYRKIGVAG